MALSAPTQPSDSHRRSLCGIWLACAVAISLSGCAAWTNPVANGVPVRLIPDELLVESRENFESVDLALLRRPPLKVYKLDVGDTLGVYVEGIIGEASVPPPVNLPSTPDEPPAIGFPFPIRADGDISLPLVQPIPVAGKTIEEAENAVIEAYREAQITREEEVNPRIIVTLLRPRTVRVLVVREDGSTPQITVSNQSLRGLGSSSTSIGGGGGSSGDSLELPIGQNDVLTALTSTGGLPGIGAKQEVVIYRGYATGDSLANCTTCNLPPPEDLVDSGLAAGRGASQGDRRVIRIPLRQRCGQMLAIPSEDVILEDGDILMIRAREPELFYTGGLLPSSEQQVPLDYDLTVVEAVLRSQGPLVNGGINSSNLTGSIFGGGIGNPSPSQLTVLRQLPRGQQVNILVDLNEALRDPRLNILVQADDVLLLQENRDEAFTRYFFTNVFQTNFFFRFINRGDAQASATFVVP